MTIDDKFDRDKRVTEQSGMMKLGDDDKTPVEKLDRATVVMLHHFRFEHLKPELQAISKPVGELARRMAELLPPGPERTAGLRKLLEAKDCFVRAILPPPPPTE